MLPVHRRSWDPLAHAARSRRQRDWYVTIFGGVHHRARFDIVGRVQHRTSFIACSKLDPRSRMSLIDAPRHPRLDPSTESAAGASQTSALVRYTVQRSLSDVSELYGGRCHAGAERDVSMISAVPSTNDMLGVHALSIGSWKGHTSAVRSNGGPKSSREFASQP